MKPFYVLAFSCATMAAQSQSYHYVYDEGVTNDYYPFSSPGTAILTEPFDDGFSTAQTIPFAWNFFGAPVTQYKVSDNGYLTFDLASPTSTNANTIIPSITDPNNAIYAFWDNLELSDNPTFVTNSVRTYTVGATPNRVHVILWNVTPKGQQGNSNYLYFSARLYEQGDFDLIYQQIRLTTTVSATSGCEDATGTDATMIAGSPNFSYTGGPYIAENVPVYRFVYGTQPDDDVTLKQVILSEVVHTNSSYDIKGKIINHGNEPVNALAVEYEVDGGPVQSAVINGLNIQPNGSYEFTHPTQWVPANPGSFQNLTLRVTLVNGSADANPQNNELTRQVWVNLGETAVKHVLIEEFSTAPCGYCPDGNLILEQILNDHPEVIAFTHHSGYLADAMTIPTSEVIANAFCPGAPLATIDRILWPDEIYVAISRSDWEDRAMESLAEAAPVDIDVLPDWNPVTREISVGVALDFVDYVLPGDLRLNVFVIEDSVIGAGAGYDQTNYYNNSPGHFYYQAGDPIVGFVHRHVIRASLTGDWGDANGIPQDAGPDDDFQGPPLKYTLPLGSKEEDVSIIAFVAYYESDRWQILNASEEHLEVVSGTGLNGPGALVVFPNPMTTSCTVQLPGTGGIAAITVLDASGRVVHSQVSDGSQFTLKCHQLPAGFYVLEVALGDQVHRSRLVIQ
jgi:hypothetical protein